MEKRKAETIEQAVNDLDGAAGDDDFGTLEGFFQEQRNADRYNPYLGDGEFKRAIFAAGRRIILVGGVKGGSGKSTVATAFIELLIRLGYRFVIIEADRGVPDVGYAFESHPNVKVIRLDLSGKPGMVALADILSRGPRFLVINTGGGHSETFQQFGSALTGVLQTFGYHLTCLWALNSQHGGIAELERFCRAMPSATVHPVLNLKEGQDHELADFNEWAQASVRPAIERQGRTLVMPVGPTSLMNALSKERISFSSLVGDGNRNIFARQELDQFLKAMEREYRRVFDFERKA